MFQKDDFVIYGNNGVCIVKDIGPLDIPGIPSGRIYYTLVPYYSKDTQIFTPADSDKVVIRPLICKEAIMQLIEEIPDIELLWIKDEKQRETQYKETLRKCDCRELIRIIKTIYQRMQNRLAEGKKMTQTKSISILRRKACTANLQSPSAWNGIRYRILFQRKYSRKYRKQ